MDHLLRHMIIKTGLTIRSRHPVMYESDRLIGKEMAKVEDTDGLCYEKSSKSNQCRLHMCYPMGVGDGKFSHCGACRAGWEG